MSRRLRARELARAEQVEVYVVWRTDTFHDMDEDCESGIVAICLTLDEARAELRAWDTPPPPGEGSFDQFSIIGPWPLSRVAEPDAVRAVLRRLPAGRA
jgi:hypothetical protein